MSGLRGVFTLLAPVILALAPIPLRAERQLINAGEIHDEIAVSPAAQAAVQDTFPSFLEYQDLVMFHPKFGYYGSGRVSFSTDYQTFPIVLAPYFGHMIAEQIFRMWEGMRAAGTLKPGETFTIGEFGAGNGAMAESILDYLEQRAPDGGKWAEFAAQTRYVCYDRSPALNRTQRERNARFGKHFDAREADATDLTATIKPGSLKGVILSNELPDAFSVHKVILLSDGSAEVAFVAPSLSEANWEKIRKEVPASLAETVLKGDRTIREKFFPGKPGQIYLTRSAFVGLLEALVSSKDYESHVQALDFHELYIPASFVTELDAHLKRNAKTYALELARSERGVVTYVNLGVERFVQGSGQVLAAGYVITLDYGANWEGIMSQDMHPHFRTYGPAHRQANNGVEADVDDSQDDSERDTSDPYSGPTLNDMTTDVNFSLLDAEGRLGTLTTAYYGPQSGLAAGTMVSMEAVPPQRQTDPDLSSEFYSWVDKFHTDANYRLMVQQKENTDPRYAYPEPQSERLVSDPNSLTESQKQRADAIEKKLRGIGAAFAAPPPAQ